MDSPSGCLIKVLSFFGELILMLGFVIIVFQCFIYMLPVLAVVVPSLIVFIGFCRAIGNWLSP